MLSSYLKTNQILFFKMTERHFTFAVKWQHSWINSCYFLASAISRSELLWLCLWCFLTDEDYVSPLPITVNNLTDLLRTITKIETFIAKCLENRWMSSRCMQDNKWVRYLTCLEYWSRGGGCYSSSLQCCAFSFRVAVTVLPINFVIVHIICNHPSY
jgi:hypothetical protein